MSKPATRGISLVRTIMISEPNRKEKVPVKIQLKVRCNASIPLDHKDFQNQYLAEDYVAPKLPPLQKKKDQKKKGDTKLQKAKNKYANKGGKTLL